MSDSELLSQDEIDALLSGVDSGEVETEAEETIDPESTQAYDFTSQDRLISGRMPTLEMINERFARNLRASLFKLLRRSPEVTVEGAQLVKYGEYIKSLLTPSNLNVVRMNPLHGNALIVCNPRLVFSLVDCFFGGGGRSQTAIDPREFTATEIRVVRRLLDLVFADLKEAWHTVLPVQFEYLNSEINPQFVKLAGAGEVVVVSAFHIGLDAGAGYLHIAIPYAAMEPVSGLLDEGGQADVTAKDAAWSGALADELLDACVELNSTLTRAEISIRDVLNFRPGDVLTVDLPEMVVARVEHVPVFRARYGISRGNFALKVVETTQVAEAVNHFKTGAEA